MAWIFGDSFQNWATGQQLRKYAAATNFNGVSSAAGRLGENGIILGTAAVEGWIVYNLPAAVSGALIAGIAAKHAGTPAAAGVPLLIFRDGATTHIDVRLLPDGSLRVTRNGTTLGTSATGVHPISSHAYVEFKALISDTVGTYEVRVEGVSVLSGTGADTRNGASAQVTNVVIGTGASIAAGPLHMGNAFYICDTTGSTCNNFLGDLRGFYQKPNAAGGSSQSVIVGGAATRHESVDDQTPDDDTTAVDIDTVGNKDRYGVENLPISTGTVHCVQISNCMKKTDAGARTARNLVELSGTEVESADINPTTSYLYYASAFPTKPGGGAWAIADVNNMELGFKVTV